MAAAVLVIAAWQLNPLAFKLSPVALAVLFFYSYTKRFTTWSHLVLGFCLGMSPAAAWIAIAGSLDWRMLILCGAVTLWVGGFDVLYACQDIEYDKSVDLFSVPKRFGIAARARDCPRDARGDDRAAGMAGMEFPSAVARLGGDRRRRRVAGLRAFAGFAERLEPDECCVFYGERLY